MRLVLTGPESTGKSSLTAYLAGRLGLPSAPEYARAYLEEHGPAYDYDLLLHMSVGHLHFQTRHVPAHAALGIFDTDLLNYRIWCEVVYGRCHAGILSAIEAESTHAYLLCSPDLPWEPDPLRECPDGRDMLFERHLAEIRRYGRPYRIIRGIGQARCECAEQASRELIAEAQSHGRLPGRAG